MHNKLANLQSFLHEDSFFFATRAVDNKESATKMLEDGVTALTVYSFRL